MSHKKSGKTNPASVEDDGTIIQEPIELLEPAETFVESDDASSEPAGETAGTSGPSHLAQKQKRSHRGLVIALCVVVGIIAAAYLAGVAWFSFHFMPNTKLNDVDVSLESKDAVASSFSSDINSYSVTISGEAISLKLSGSDIGLALDTNTFTSEALAQENAWLWPVLISQTHDITSSVKATYDKSALDSKVSAAVKTANANATQPSDAKLTYDTTSASFVVTKEVYGSSLDSDATLAFVEEKVSNLERTVTITEDQLAKPKVLSTDSRLSSAVSSANALLGADITLTMAGTKVYEVNAQVIAQMITFDANLTPTLSDSAVAAWASSEFGSKYDTIGSERTYTRTNSDGTTKTITVSGGDYGWGIDSAALGNELVTKIKAKAVETLEVPTTSQAQVFTGVGQRDWGASYVDVDITEQHVRYYDSTGALVWETDCVTGSNEHPTPTGVYDLNAHDRDVTLLGEILASTGAPEYQSFVSYWMPFVGNSVGLHDATWRSVFGGTIYQYGGSHGCVNLPADMAASLYDLIGVGTVVITHY